MKANELRIGNFVNVPREDQSPFRIDVFEYLSNTFIKVAMTHPEFGDKMHPLTWYGEDLKPIPLTEEWLVEFGFSEMYATKNEHHPFFKRSGFGKEIELYPPKEKSKHPNAFHFVVGGVRVQSFHIDVQYVHQLQNLYFALTGEELTIKENDIQTN